MDFNLHRLRLLLELSHCDTINGVAIALGYSPATVSQQLALLQREVGVTLLEPHGRGVRLTPVAHVLLDHADAVFQRLSLAEADLARAEQEIVGVVRVAAFQTAMLVLFPPVLRLLRARHPALRVEVVHAESELVRAGSLPRDFDLVIDEVYPGTPLARSEKLYQELLFTDSMRLAEFSHTPNRTELRSYADAAWVMEPEGSPAREWAVAECRAAGFEPDIQFVSTDVVVHERLVGTGHAVAFLPDLLPSRQETSIYRRKLDTAHSRQIVTTARASARQHPAISALLDALRQIATRIQSTV